MRTVGEHGREQSEAGRKMRGEEGEWKRWRVKSRRGVKNRGGKGKVKKKKEGINGEKG